MPTTTIQTAQIRDASVTEAKLLLSDNTTGNVSNSRHGFVPKLPNDSALFLNGAGLFANPTTLNSAPGNNLFSGPTVTLTAAQNLSQWDVCYVNVASKMAKGSALLYPSSVIFAMATAAMNTDQTGTFLLSNSFVQNNSWSWTAGGVLYLSATAAGAMTQVAPSSTGQCVTVLGVALSSTVVYFDPQLVIVEIA